MKTQKKIGTNIDKLENVWKNLKNSPILSQFI